MICGLRRELEEAAPSLETYYASLGTRVRVRRETPDSRARVAQLVKKTNQFNLTLRRHGERELEALRARGAAVLGLEVEDRFGDSGLSGVAILEPAQDAWRLDSFLVSCRVLGRGVEQAFLAEVADLARASGAGALIGEFRPGPRNAPARDFLARHGFIRLDGAPTANGGPGANGGGAVDASSEWWILDLGHARVERPAWVEVVR